MNICPHEDCSGCSACMHICAKNAISMIADHEGFYRPVINETLCVNCGMCKKVCPQNQFSFNNYSSPKCYAIAADDTTRAKSSSGAFFPVLARYVLTQGGFVCGAAFDDAMNLRHIIISDERELFKLQGSKYLQSQLCDTFAQIKKLLVADKTVLFTGTPCQVAGLLSFLRKDYPKLITVDLICHGVPSQNTFSSYLQSEFPGQNIKSVNFRDKTSGWGNAYTITITTDKTERSTVDSEDAYMQAFFANINLRESCYKCKFTRMPRCGDFTMADFWGLPKKYDDQKGTSCIFLNNAKAEIIYTHIQDKFKFVKKFPAQLPIKVQPQLKDSVIRHPARNSFFDFLNHMDIRQALQQTLFSKKNIALLNFHWENVNFGAVLTSYALHEYLTKAGYYVRNIDYIPDFPWIEEEEPNAAFDAFRKRHMNFTRRFNSGSTLQELNEEIYTYIVGSDQVWRPDFIKNDLDAFFFSHAGSGKKRIAYAASFGVGELNLPSSEQQEFAALINRFDYVSVREKRGVEICASIGIKAEQVLDPVFLLSQQHWLDLANEANCDETEDAIVYYTISDTIESSILSFIDKHRETLPSANVKNITDEDSIEGWLKSIRDCRFFITDSFHGSCFAIIFNKPFICVNPSTATTSRMQALFDSLCVKQTLFSGFDQVPLGDVLNNPVCYETTNKLWAELRDLSEKFLISAIENEGFSEEELRTRDTELQKIRLQQAKQNIRRVHKEYLRCKLMRLISINKKRKSKYKKKLQRARRAYRNYREILKNSN